MMMNDVGCCMHDYAVDYDAKQEHKHILKQTGAQNHYRQIINRLIRTKTSFFLHCRIFSGSVLFFVLILKTIFGCLFLLKFLRIESLIIYYFASFKLICYDLSFNFL